MPRTKRICPGGMIFHVLNRGVGRMKLFATERDYEAFEEAVAGENKGVRSIYGRGRGVSVSCGYATHETYLSGWDDFSRAQSGRGKNEALRHGAGL